MKLSSYDVGKVVRDLIRIAEVAMPPHLIQNDPRVQAGRDLLTTVNVGEQRPPSVPFEVMPQIGDPAAPDVAPWA